MKSKKNYNYFFIFSIFILFYTLVIPKVAYADSSSIFDFLNSFFPQTKQTEQVSLKSEDLAKIIQPSIVRIIRQTKGNVILHSDFSLDFINLKILKKPLVKPISIPVDDTMSGTGFMISPDGHIMSNSHVVSSQSSVNEVVAQLASYLIKKQLANLTIKEQKVFENNASTTEGSKLYVNFGTEIAKSMLSEVTLDASTTITVLNPSSNEDSWEGFVKNGFPASIVSVNDNYNDDQRDVAIIKINQNNLPSISVSNNVSTSSLVIGQKIYAFGFPANADVNSKLGHDFVEPTFTSGTIGSLKSSDKGDFQIIETDTKISSGSSGSPAIDEQGRVVGIMTYVTGSNGGGGDTFAFALPIGVIRPIISEAQITSDSGPLYQHFILGLNLFSLKHCKQAISEFELAKNINSNFPANTVFIDSYINKCKTMQTAGQSIDNSWQQFLQNIKPYQTLFLISLFIFILLVVIIIFALALSRKNKKIEAEMDDLRLRNKIVPENISSSQSFQNSNLEVENIKPTISIPIQSKPEPINTPIINLPIESKSEIKTVTPEVNSRIEEIVNFIKKEKKEDKNLGLVVVALRNQGFNDNEIQEGFNVVNKG